MARGINRLSAKFAATAKGPKYHADGGGLYLQVTAKGARSWVFVFQWEGRRSEMGLGSAAPDAVSLADARKRRDAARELLDAGTNPIAARKAAPPPVVVVPTFGDVAKDLVASLAPGWKNTKTPQQWLNTLQTHAPALWAMKVRDVATEDVLAALTPIWNSKAETASRLRSRIERVLRAAKVKGYRTGDNPAAWRDHLAAILPPRRKLARGHHPAMPYGDVPAFLASLRARDALAARALEFTILNGSRTTEVVAAPWSEIDRKAAVWTIPGQRMKNGLEHRVPMCRRAVDILDAVAQEYGTEGFVFPGTGASGHLSTGAMERVLDRMDLSHFTVHGFRSSFRDWAGEATSFPRELAEMSLSHVVGDEVERAYRRGDALDRRRKLMTAWGGYCEKVAA